MPQGCWRAEKHLVEGVSRLREEDVSATARYVLNNPIRAGLVEDLMCYPYWDASWL
jgi:hypothetical protein